MSSESLTETVTLPTGQVGVQLVAGQPALLVGSVRFASASGEVLPRLTLGGRSVESGASGLIASARQLSGAVGIGLIHDPHDGLVIDEEEVLP